MFTWICPKCGREVPPAYDECPDCAAKTAAGAVPVSTTPPGAVASPPQSQPAAPASGTRVSRRPLWATGAQEAMPPAPPPSFATSQPAAPAPPPVAATEYRPQHSTSPMFQPPPPEAPQYAPPRPTSGNHILLTGIAIAVIVVMTAGAVYWFFLRGQQGSAAETPVAAAPAPAVAGENPVDRFVEVAGIRFSSMTKGIQIAFVLINHSDQDLVGLTGTATVLAKTNSGQEIQMGSVKFETSMGAQTSKELTLPFDTTKKMVDMPDWQNVSVKVDITSPKGS